MTLATPIPEKVRDLISVSSQAVYFDMYEGATSVTDKLGNSTGITTTNGTGVDANAGWFTGTGTAYCRETAEQAIHDACSVASNGQLIISFDIYFAATHSTNHGVLNYGRYAGSFTTGGWLVYALGTEQVRFDWRPQNGSQNPGASTTVLATDVRHTLTIDANMLNGTIDIYADGISTPVSTESGVDFGTPVSNETSGGLVLGGRMGTSTSVDQQLPTDARAANILILNITTPDTALAQSINAEMYADRHEIPWAIDGK